MPRTKNKLPLLHSRRSPLPPSVRQIALIGVSAVLSMTGFANAAFTSLSSTLWQPAQNPACNWSTTLTSPPSYVPATGPDAWSAGDALLTATGCSSDFSSYNLLGGIDSDPTLYSVVEVQNTTSSPWTFYQVQIDPGASGGTTGGLAAYPFLPPNSSEYLLPNSSVNGDTIDFYGGVVNPGQTLEIVYSFVETPPPGSGDTTFDAQITDTVPEPTSGAMLCIGAVGLLKRRRRST